MAFYGSLEWNYEWKFLPTESFADYTAYIAAVRTATTTNGMWRVEKLLLDRDESTLEEAQRMSSKTKLVRLRDTAAGSTTWRHYFCNETGEEVFLMTPAHFHTVFTNPTP